MAKGWKDTLRRAFVRDHPLPRGFSGSFREVPGGWLVLLLKASPLIPAVETTNLLIFGYIHQLYNALEQKCHITHVSSSWKIDMTVISLSMLVLKQRKLTRNLQYNPISRRRGRLGQGTLFLLTTFARVQSCGASILS